jgi:hypothetical protein
MRGAGERFQALFRVAQLDPLKALDISERRPTGIYRPQPTAPDGRIENARSAVWAANLAAGGLSQPGGCCLWNVVGWGQTVKQWAADQGRSQEAAAGILICALGVLEAHFARRS